MPDVASPSTAPSSVPPRSELERRLTQPKPATTVRDIGPLGAHGHTTLLFVAPRLN